MTRASVRKLGAKTFLLKDIRPSTWDSLFGDVSDMPKMLLFVGTREIFYPDVISFYEKLHSAGTKAELIIGQNMNHVYPLYPIPEAKTAFGRIIKELA